MATNRLTRCSSNDPVDTNWPIPTKALLVIDIHLGVPIDQSVKSAFLVVVAGAAVFLVFTTPGQNVLCALGFATGCVFSGY